MAGILSYFQDPGAAGGLGLATGLLQAGGPSRMPVSFGQALSTGLLQGTNMQEAARRANMNADLLNAQTRHLVNTDDLLRVQIENAVRNQAIVNSILGRYSGGGQQPTGQPQAQVGVSDQSAGAVGAPWAASSVNPQPQQGAPGPTGQGGEFPFSPMDLAALKMAGIDLTGVANYAKPFSGRAGAPIWGIGPDGKPQIQGYAPKLGEGMGLDQSGNVTVTPGYSAARQAINSIPNPSAPMQTVQVSNQRQLQLTQPEYLAYTGSGGKVLPSRYAPLSRELPGVQFQDAGGATGAPTGQMPPAFGRPVETPAQRTSANDARLRILSAEIADQETRGAVDPALRREYQRAGGPPADTGDVGVLGATQSQAQQVAQAGQTAESAGYGKQLSDYAGGVIQDAAKAAVANRYLDNMELAAKDINLGKLAPAQSAMTQWAQAFGVELPEEAKKSAGSIQALTSMAIKMAGTATRQSDAQPSQLQYFKILESMPNEQRTADGFRKIVAYLRDANNYSIAKAQALQQWRSAHQGSANGFEAQWPAQAARIPFVWNQAEPAPRPARYNPATGKIER